VVSSARATVIKAWSGEVVTGSQVSQAKQQCSQTSAKPSVRRPVPPVLARPRSNW